jgi:hypothetical protein
MLDKWEKATQTILLPDLMRYKSFARQGSEYQEVGSLQFKERMTQGRISCPDTEAVSAWAQGKAPSFVDDERRLLQARELVTKAIPSTGDSRLSLSVSPWSRTWGKSST